MLIVVNKPIMLCVVMLSVVAPYRALDGSPYPGLKLVPSSLCKIFIIVKKYNNLYLGVVTPSSG